MKKIISGIVITALAFSVVGNSVIVTAKSPEVTENIISHEISDRIPEDATRLVEQQLDSIIKVSKDFSKDLDIDETQLEEVSIGTPYIIYDVADTKQDEIYHYPIINNKNEEVVLMVNVMGTTDGWHYDISTENISKLNVLNYANEEYIFYGTEGNIIAENDETKKTLIGNNENVAIQEFENSDLSKKVDAISERIDKLQKTDVNSSVKRNLKFAYSPKVVDVEVGTGKKCELYNRQTQGSYGLCWAASVATISNYLNGTNYTACQIADKEGIGYNDGVYGPAAVLKAMEDFGVPYHIVAATLLWSEIKSKIVSKIPIYIAANSNDGGHSTVLYGYKNKNGTQYIVMWNPGSAETQIVEYAGSYTTYSYVNTTFKWTESIYM